MSDIDKLIKAMTETLRRIDENTPASIAIEKVRDYLADHRSGPNGWQIQRSRGCYYCGTDTYESELSWCNGEQILRLRCETCTAWYRILSVLDYRVWQLGLSLDRAAGLNDGQVWTVAMLNLGPVAIRQILAHMYGTEVEG